jgi:hypothetical protein
MFEGFFGLFCHGTLQTEFFVGFRTAARLYICKRYARSEKARIEAQEKKRIKIRQQLMFFSKMPIYNRSRVSIREKAKNCSCGYIFDYVFII